MTPKLALFLRAETLAVARLAPEEAWPDWALNARFVVLARTEDELSIVCDESLVPGSVRAERGWRAIQTEGPLDFGITGLLAGLTKPLADAAIAVFAISTFDTDLLLVRQERVDAAIKALLAAGYAVRPAK